MVSSHAKTVSEYLASLPDDRRAHLAKVRAVVKKNLPKGYVEGMQYGMISWFVPLSRYPDTYNGQPLAVASLASQKLYMSLYLMGVYADPETQKWFETAYRKSGKKLDMGKSCVTFRSTDDLALGVIGKVIARISADDLIACYERAKAPAKKKAAAKKRVAAHARSAKSASKRRTKRKRA